MGGVNEVTPQETYGLAYSAFPTPEPSGLLLVAGAGFMLLTRRRGRSRGPAGTRVAARLSSPKSGDAAKLGIGGGALIDFLFFGQKHRHDCRGDEKETVV